MGSIPRTYYEMDETPKPDEIGVGRQRLHRMHPIIFGTVFGAFAWMMAAAFAGFAEGMQSAFALTVATLLIAVYIVIPIMLDRMRTPRDGYREETTLSRWFGEWVQTQSGPLKGYQALVQAATGPVSLAAGMTGFAVVAMFIL